MSVWINPIDLAFEQIIVERKCVPTEAFIAVQPNGVPRIGVKLLDKSVKCRMELLRDRNGVHFYGVWTNRQDVNGRVAPHVFQENRIFLRKILSHVAKHREFGVPD